MKKWIASILVFVITAVCIATYQYNTYKTQQLQMQKLNAEYENFIKGEILGTSLITLINKTMDLNKKNGVELDKNNLFIENDTNSIKIDVKFLESNKTFPMERIASLGSELFVKNYSVMYFKCIQKEYHEKTNNIKYLLFEQI